MTRDCIERFGAIQTELKFGTTHGGTLLLSSLIEKYKKYNPRVDETMRAEQAKAAAQILVEEATAAQVRYAAAAEQLACGQDTFALDRAQLQKDQASM